MSLVKLKTGQKSDRKKLDLQRMISEEDRKAELKELELMLKIERTEKLLNIVSMNMDILEIDNFDNLFPELISNMKEAAILREELIKEFGSEELLKNRPKLFIIAKQIEKKYDNLVEKYTLETSMLQRELAVVSNKKKITNYLR